MSNPHTLIDDVFYERSHRGSKLKIMRRDLCTYIVKKGRLISSYMLRGTSSSKIAQCTPSAQSTLLFVMYANIWFSAFYAKNKYYIYIKGLKFVFYKLFANSATRWVFLCGKIISNISKSVWFFSVLMKNQIFDIILLCLKWLFFIKNSSSGIIYEKVIKNKL